MKDKTIEIFDKWAERYDEDVHRAQSKGDLLYENYSLILERLVIEVKEELPLGAIIIDIGSGTGNLLFLLSSRGYYGIGVEPSKNMRKKSKEKYPYLKVVPGDFFCLPFKDKTIDGIVSTYAWHHLNHRGKMKSIKEMKRVLKDEGIILIADLMFQDKVHRKRMLKEFKNQRNYEIIKDIKSEYYGDLKALMHGLGNSGFDCIGERMNRLVWMLKAKRRI